jgi:hypothetical protein
MNIAIQVQGFRKNTLSNSIDNSDQRPKKNVFLVSKKMEMYSKHSRSSIINPREEKDFITTSFYKKAKTDTLEGCSKN